MTTEEAFVKVLQKRNSILWYDDNFVGTELDPHLSYGKVAEACGLKGVVARTQAELTAALSKMAQRGQITGAIVDGLMLFDIAVADEAARIKGIEVLSRDRPDIWIVPNLEAGNLLYKQLVCLAHAECAGIVLGAHAPIVLTSRADSAKCRVASCALAVIEAQRTALKPPRH